MLKHTVKIMSIAKLETHSKRQTFYLQAPFYNLVRWDHMHLCVFQKMMERNLPRYLYATWFFFLSDLLKLANGKATWTGSLHKSLLWAGWRDVLESPIPQYGSISIPFLILMFIELFIINQFIDL